MTTDKQTLLLARVGPHYAHQIARNPWIQEAYRIVTLDQRPLEEYDTEWQLYAACLEDRPFDGGEARTEAFLEALLDGWKVTAAIIGQKILWYPELLGRLCRERGIGVLWTERFFGDRLIFDRAGLPYTRVNDLMLFEPEHAPRPYALPCYTREPQPPHSPPDQLYSRYGREGIVVLGQTRYDMSVREFPGLGYIEWLDRLFRCNPQTPFLFKHHPAFPTPGIGIYSNVTVLDEDIRSLFGAYDLFASFSSTTIFEGVARGKRFLTGGYHFCSGLTLELGENDMADAAEKLADYPIPDGMALEKRMSFINNAYTLALNSHALYDRLAWDSAAFFGQ